MPNLSCILFPLYRLLQKNCPWVWSTEQSKAFSAAKELPQSSSILVHFPAEKEYSQIEKEALAIIFAVRKFHQYLHGRHFLIHSDHKLLQYLFSETKQVPVMASEKTLAIIFAVQKFYQYFHGRQFLIHSDHKPLQYLFCETVPVMASARIQR